MTESGNGINSSPPAKEGCPKDGVVRINNSHIFKSFRKKLRQNLTPAEAKLWSHLQNAQLGGRKFRRQHSIGKFVLDFYCPLERLGIELDGNGHFVFGQKYDARRDALLEQYGIKIIRFGNSSIFEQTDAVLESIRKEFGWLKIRS